MAIHVVVIGGGLAGMTAALELARHKDVKVTLLEADTQLGGKAGAKEILDPLYNEGSVWEDHGYHIFPGWYVNTRRLLKELNCEDDLIDLNCFHHLVRVAPDQVKRVTMYEWSTLQGIRANLRAGLLPWYETALS